MCQTPGAVALLGASAYSAAASVHGTRLRRCLAMEDFEYLKLLRASIESGAITPILDFAKLEHMDSPISVESDTNRLAYVLIILVGGALWFWGMWAGIGVALAGVVAWFAVLRGRHRRRMEQRLRQQALNDLETWKKLWRMTGVTLINAKTGAECVSPAGNWRAFVGVLSPSPEPPL